MVIDLLFLGYSASVFVVLLNGNDFPKPHVKFPRMKFNQKLIENGFFKLTEHQARSILEIKLSRLTGLERSKLSNEDCCNLINFGIQIDLPVFLQYSILILLFI